VIGARVVVGALPRQVAGLVLHNGLRLTVLGITLGMAAAIGAGRVLTSLLYEVKPSDPLTLTSMAVLFLIVSTAAILIPVWRAIRVDPVCALRE
jgi:ABC-type antimicrobial peptide transport system permease subunit